MGQENSFANKQIHSYFIEEIFQAQFQFIPFRIFRIFFSISASIPKESRAVSREPAASFSGTWDAG